MEWIEEAHACMRARHLSVADEAFFCLIIWRGKHGKRSGIGLLRNGMILIRLLSF